VLGRLRYNANANLPFVAFLTPPAGRLDSGSIGPALSRPYRCSPLCSRSISTSSPGICAYLVCPSSSRTSPDTKGPGNFPRRSGIRRHKECMQYSPTWYSIDRRPNRQGSTATLARPHGWRCPDDMSLLWSTADLCSRENSRRLRVVPRALPAIREPAGGRALGDHATAADLAGRNSRQHGRAANTSRRSNAHTRRRPGPG
jgi:hypothetical protein